MAVQHRTVVKSVTLDKRPNNTTSFASHTRKEEEATKMNKLINDFEKSHEKWALTIVLQEDVFEVGTLYLVARMTFLRGHCVAQK